MSANIIGAGLTALACMTGVSTAPAPGYSGAFGYHEFAHKKITVYDSFEWSEITLGALAGHRRLTIPSSNTNSSQGETIVVSCDVSYYDSLSLGQQHRCVAR